MLSKSTVRRIQQMEGELLKPLDGGTGTYRDLAPSFHNQEFNRDVPRAEHDKRGREVWEVALEGRYYGLCAKTGIPAQNYDELGVVQVYKDIAEMEEMVELDSKTGGNGHTLETKLKEEFKELFSPISSDLLDIFTVKTT